MSTTPISRRLRFLLVGSALAVTLAVPAVAFADTIPTGSGGATVTVASVSVVGKAVAVVHLNIVCDPLEAYDWMTDQTYPTTDGHTEFATITVLQAQGRTLDSGTTEFGAVLVCDGATVNHVDASVAASVSPWRNGTAVISGSVYITDPTFNSSDSASFGPTAVRLSLK